MNSPSLSGFLGWFSIGLGVAEVFYPREMEKLIGVPRGGHDGRGILPWLGAREMVSGLGILTQPKPAGWLWSRVAGDVMDLSLLAAALRSPEADRRRVETAMAAVFAVGVLDVLASVRASRTDADSRRHGAGAVGNAIESSWQEPEGPRVRRSITINRSPEEVYAFWRKFNNLARFMHHLESVEDRGDGRSHWVARGPLNTHVEWEAEITHDRPGESLAWRSLPDSQIETSGSVRFDRATGGRGTVVRVDLEYRAPGGAVGAALAKVLRFVPDKFIHADLLRLKQLVETGEITRTEGQPAGRERSTSRKYDDLVRA